MKPTILASIVTVTSLALACSQPPENLTLGEPRTFENLTLYPVHANEAFLGNRSKVGGYLTLKEAVDAGKVKVTEVDDGDVNTLLVENLSTDTVMILNGETVEGGKQNRMIARDVVLAPHSGKLDVAVFCVEEGRWTAEQEFKVTKQSLPPGPIRSKLNVEVADQEEVWEDVKVNLEAFEVNSPTGALHDLKSSSLYRDNETKYVDHFSAAFEKANIVGVVAVTADGSMTCDIFATPALFQKHYANLLQSYAGQAMVSDNAAATKPDMGNFWRRAMGKMKKDGFLGRSGSKRSMHFVFVFDTDQ